MNTAINGLLCRVSLAFAVLLDTRLIAFVRNVITLMTGNAQYPSPSHTLAAMTTSVNAFEVAVHDALDGGKIAIATRNAARVDLLSSTRQLAAYVQGNCNDDLVALLSSGFDAVKAKSPSYLPPIPANQRLDQTNKSGEPMLKFEKVPNAPKLQHPQRDQPGWAVGRPGSLRHGDPGQPDTRQGLLGARLRERLARVERLRWSCDCHGGVSGKAERLKH